MSFLMSSSLAWGLQLPSIGIERQDVGMEALTTINDFPADKLPQESWFDKLKTDLKHYMVIHPYYLKRGQNDLLVYYWISDPREVDMGTYQLILTLTDMDYKNLKSEKSRFKLQSPELYKTDESQKNKVKLEAKFDFNEKIPEWGWLKGVKIENSEKTKKSLLAEYKKLWDKLNSLPKMSAAERKKFVEGLKESTKEFVQASEMRGEKYKFIDEMIEMATTMKERKIPLLMRPLNFEKIGLKIFAGGTLAKLVNEPDSFFERDMSIEYVGGAHDADPGPAGENFAFWFRKDKKDTWVVDAVVPLGALSY